MNDSVMTLTAADAVRVTELNLTTKDIAVCGPTWDGCPSRGRPEACASSARRTSGSGSRSAARSGARRSRSVAKPQPAAVWLTVKQAVARAQVCPKLAYRKTSGKSSLAAKPCNRHPQTFGQFSGSIRVSQ